MPMSSFNGVIYNDPADNLDAQMRNILVPKTSYQGFDPYDQHYNF